MVLIKSLLLSTFALLTTASPLLLARDAPANDSITYCSTPNALACTLTPDPSSKTVVTLPADYYSHFECYTTVDGV